MCYFSYIQNCLDCVQNAKCKCDISSMQYVSYHSVSEQHFPMTHLCVFHVVADVAWFCAAAEDEQIVVPSLHPTVCCEIIS